ncbi:alpha/beta hydrolase [Exiguobacterium sp. H66]|uniref:alpha/beta fold hydrolase n=1 Tax=Exiguobacterium sp. H66 TaxID=2751208 RepID=UPI001BE8B399|nr:alpha/beta hydrolase [Exiguobacterium sp. H66]
MKRYNIECAGTSTQVTEWGEPDRPVIFCLHGLGGTSLSFIELADALKHDYRIVSIDAPGHGKTEPFADENDYRFARFSDWLNQLFEHLHIEDFYFLSHSWGSFIALFYQKEQPERVRGSILIDGGYQSKRLRGTPLEQEAAFYETDFEESVATLEAFLDVAVYGPKMRRSPLLDLAGQDFVRMQDGRYYWHARAKTARAILAAMYQDEILDFLDDVPGKNVLLLRATLPVSDEPFRQEAIAIWQEKTGGTVISAPSTSHILHWDDPEVVLEVIRKNWSTDDVSAPFTR